MTAEFNNKGSYREIMAINFDNDEEYKKFITDLAQAISYDLRFYDELERNIAEELANRHLDQLATSVFNILIDEVNQKPPEGGERESNDK